MNKMLSILILSLGLVAAAHADTAQLADEEIAAIVVDSNTAEINAGSVAKTKGASSAVRAFARKMVTEHRKMNKEAVALTKKLDIRPAENDISKQVKADGETTLHTLKDLKGKDFDKAYIEDQVKAHQMVLDTISNKLLPNAKNPDLKDMLTKAQPKVQAHLEQAKQIESKLQ